MFLIITRTLQESFIIARVIYLSVRKYVKSIKKPVSDLKDTNYLQVKATLNRCVFRANFKFSKDDAFLISAGIKYMT